MSFSRLTFVALLAAVLAGNAHAYRGELEEARELAGLGALDQALALYEEALAHKRLKGRNRDRAQTEYQQLKLQLARARYDSAVARNQKGELLAAVAELKEVVALDPSNALYQQTLQRWESKIAALNDQARRLFEDTSRSGEWALGLSNGKSLEQYRAQLPEVDASLDALRKSAINAYTDGSDRAFDDGDYGRATQLMVQAAQLEPTRSSSANGRAQVNRSHQAYLEGDLERAWQASAEAARIAPGDDRIRDYHEVFGQRWAADMYNQATSARVQGQINLAMVRITELLRRVRTFPGAHQMRQELRNELGITYKARADDLLAEGKHHVGLALAYLQIVKEQQPDLFPGIDAEIARVKQMLMDEIEVRVALDITNTAEVRGITGIVRSQVQKTLGESPKLRTVTLLDREYIQKSLFEQGLGQGFVEESTAAEVKRIRGIGAWLEIDVARMEIFEYGRDQPTYGHQEYVARMETVANPAYLTLEKQIEMAEAALDSRSKGNSTAKRRLSELLGEKSLSRREVQDFLSDLQYQLQDVAPQIEQPVTDRWRYEIYNMSISGEVQLNLRAVDVETQEHLYADTARATQRLTDRWVPGDPGRGVEHDPNLLPTPDIFREELLQEAISELVGKLEFYFGGFSTRYFEAAQDMAVRNDTNGALENFIRFLYSAPTLNDRRVAAADDFIYRHLGLHLVTRQQT